MKPTRSNKWFFLNNSQWLEIIAKLQKPNPPTNELLHVLIVYLKVPLESYGATKTQYLNTLSLFLNQLEFQPSMSVKHVFLNQKIISFYGLIP